MNVTQPRDEGWWNIGLFKLVNRLIVQKQTEGLFASDRPSVCTEKSLCYTKIQPLFCEKLLAFERIIFQAERAESTYPLLEHLSSGAQKSAFSRYPLLARRLRAKLKRLNARCSPFLGKVELLCLFRTGSELFASDMN